MKQIIQSPNYLFQEFFSRQIIGCMVAEQKVYSLKSITNKLFCQPMLSFKNRQSAQAYPYVRNRIHDCIVTITEKKIAKSRIG